VLHVETDVLVVALVVVVALVGVVVKLLHLFTVTIASYGWISLPWLLIAYIVHLGFSQTCPQFNLQLMHGVGKPIA